MTRILLLGGYGMLGTDMYEILTSSEGTHEVLRFSSSDLDITDVEALREAFMRHRPDWVINCAAYTAVELAEDELEKATAINSTALEGIGKAAREVGAKVIHFSTDYVFDGDNAMGYQEDDRKNPLGAYGRSKSLGEDLLFRTHPEGSYVIRTAWLYGHHGKNFVKTMLRLAAEKPEIRVVSDQTGCPTWTWDLAQAVRENFFQPSPHRTTHTPSPGIFHLVNSLSCTWYDFAVEIMRQAGLSTRVTPITSEGYPTKAVRPKSSILLNTKLPSLPTWQEGLRGYFSTTP